jgi:hypothetical protein
MDNSLKVMVGVARTAFADVNFLFSHAKIYDTVWRGERVVVNRGSPLSHLFLAMTGSLCSARGLSVLLETIQY